MNRMHLIMAVIAVLAVCILTGIAYATPSIPIPPP
jgi:hypothetical protein